MELSVTLREPHRRAELFGPGDRYLREIRDMLKVRIQTRNTTVNIVGQPPAVARAAAVLEHLQDVLRGHSQVAFTVLCGLTALVRHLSDRVVEFSTLGVNNRIHAELLRLAKKVSGNGGLVEISHPPTHADIASRVSTRREAVTKEFSRLSEMGLIERRGKSLVVRDMERLERMIDEVKTPSD